MRQPCLARRRLPDADRANPDRYRAAQEFRRTALDLAVDHPRIAAATPVQPCSVPLAIESIRRASAAGRFRPQLDPKLALVSCLGMAVMPFIAAPVFATVFGDDFANDPEPLIAHTLEMLRHALRAPRP